METGRGPGSYIHLAETVQIRFRVDPRAVSGIDIGIPYLEQLCGPEHHIGEIIHCIPASRIYPPQGDGLV